MTISNERKLEAVSVTLTMLLPYLQPGIHKSDVEECIKLTDQVRKDLEEKDNGNDEEGLRAGSESDQGTEGTDG